MPVQGLSLREQHLYKVIDRVNQIMQGRTNATGTITLSSTGATLTTVSSATICQLGSKVFLTPQTAHAAAMQVYVVSTNVSSGQFIVTQSCSTSTDLTYGWAVFG